VLWRCWFGGRKGIRPVKNWAVGCWHGYLSGARADLHMAQLMPLPLTVTCFSKIQIGFTFLVPAHLGSPGQRAVKRVCVNGCVCPVSQSVLLMKTITMQLLHPASIRLETTSRKTQPHMAQSHSTGSEIAEHQSFLHENTGVWFWTWLPSKSTPWTEREKVNHCSHRGVAAPFYDSRTTAEWLAW